MKREDFAVAALLIGLPLVSVLAFTGAFTPGPNGTGGWIYEYQGLIAGMLGLAGGTIAFLTTRYSVESTRRDDAARRLMSYTVAVRECFEAYLGCLAPAHTTDIRTAACERLRRSYRSPVLVTGLVDPILGRDAYVLARFIEFVARENHRDEALAGSAFTDLTTAIDTKMRLVEAGQQLKSFRAMQHIDSAPYRVFSAGE